MVLGLLDVAVPYDAPTFSLKLSTLVLGSSGSHLISLTALISFSSCQHIPVAFGITVTSEEYY